MTLVVNRENERPGRSNTSVVEKDTSLSSIQGTSSTIETWHHRIPMQYGCRVCKMEKSIWALEKEEIVEHMCEI
jgi:hypothetical protein